MAQRNWTYKNENGPDYEVGLYHGDDSGHVMIYVGQQIIKIDFSVFDEKKYHFQLGTELVVLIVNYGQQGSFILFNEKTGKEIPNNLGSDFPKKNILLMALVLMACLIVVFMMYFL